MTTSSIPASPAVLLPRAARRERGQALRRSVPRSSHAQWSPPKERVDPLSLLNQQSRLRIPSLIPVRYERMRASPFAFLRGAAIVMAADLAHTPASGPTVQACGDCHLANFGSYASPEGIPVFDINDFDETLRAPFEWDIKRLGTSLILAGAETGLADRGAQSLANIMAQTYCTEMARLSRLSPLQVWVNRVDLQSAIEHFENPKTRHRVETLLKQRLDSTRNAFGLISDDSNAPSLRESPPLTMRLPEQDTAIRAAFARYIATQPQERLALLNCYTLRDVIFKVVGIGSVGTFCAIGLFTTADNEPLLLQIKEAQASVLTPYVSGKSPFHNQGKRVVTGQRIMQAVSDSFLGWTDSPDDAPHNPATITPADSSSPVPNDEERQFYVRRVKDTRLAAIGADFAQDGLEDYARLCGRVLARVHARSGDPVTISAYAGKGSAFADAIADFSVAYAQQTRQDWQHFVASTTGKSATGKKSPSLT
ncbi:DUF2252 domain-containing protein [Acetobacter estunensis]|uniref:DUF2252 domain-containing protein n=1 Tax=Acetobacter estunensis TaxID=104097 RepID=A0A967B6U0_9PROT|nr:DUF2252 domain-containing protein [Acetobacter estunensis]NHO54254.1 DUF2252 domain-containing protein [Acetobacter estunensis]